MKPITIEELKKLNPTPESPVELVCCNGLLTMELKEISVTAIGVNNLLAINAEGAEQILYCTGLKHYTLKPKKVKRWVNLYKRIDGTTQWIPWSCERTASQHKTNIEGSCRIACIEIEVDEGVL